MAMFNTYDHTKVTVQINGIVLTDFNGDITVSGEGDKFEIVQGQNGAVERSFIGNRLYTVTLPFHQTSAQLNALETLSQADQLTGAGPFPFSITKVGIADATTTGAYVLMGRATIQSMGDVTLGRSATARTVTLSVYKDAGFEGAN